MYVDHLTHGRDQSSRSLFFPLFLVMTVGFARPRAVFWRCDEL